MDTSPADLRERYRSLALWAPMLLILIFVANIAEAQQAATSGSQTSTNSEPPAADSVQPKNDRIFGVLPNYRTVENPNIRMAPLSAKGKFKLAVEDSFDPYAYVIAGAFADLDRRRTTQNLGAKKAGAPLLNAMRPRSPIRRMRIS